MARIDYQNTHCYVIDMNSVADLADVCQGLSRVGRGAGSRHGDWMLKIVESGDLYDDGWLETDGLRHVGVVRSSRIERHLLRPFDVLVTARAGTLQVALVPPGVSRTVAGVTLLVARPQSPESGMGHWLWYFLTSSQGRTQLTKRLVVSSTVTTLSARSLGEVEIPMPTSRDLDAVARLVEASEDAYAAAVEAARMRREALRDSVIHEIGRKTVSTSEGRIPVATH